MQPGKDTLPTSAKAVRILPAEVGRIDWMF